jgi:hypothetical protein
MTRSDAFKVAFLVALAIGNGACEPSCPIDVLNSKTSPDGRWKAVHYARDCEGATGGWTYHVAVIPASADLTDRDGIFACEPTKFVDARLNVTWVTSKRLRVAYLKGLQVYTKEQPANGVTVDYVVE